MAQKMSKKSRLREDPFKGIKNQAPLAHFNLDKKTAF